MDKQTQAELWARMIGDGPQAQLLSAETDGDGEWFDTPRGLRARRVGEPFPYEVGATISIPADGIRGFVIQDSDGVVRFVEYWERGAGRWMANVGDTLTFAQPEISFS